MRESMEFDVVIVGGGPAGLSTSIRLAQLAQQKQKTLNICLVDKGAEIGSHILSGAAIDPRSLNELIPDWQDKGAPLTTPITQDRFVLLTHQRSITLPTPPQMRNHGNYIISLGLFCRWLAQQAESLGVNIFPSFAATDILFNGDRVCGITIGDKGLDRFGQPKTNFQPGMDLLAKQVIFAEGCRGSLTQKLFKQYKLRENCDPQTYALGIKEIWEIPEHLHHAGSVMHSIGWPLDNKTYGGSFVYQYGRNLISVGFAVGLDYKNPYLSPYEEFQLFKSHPVIHSLLKTGRRIAYGARTIVEGGLQSLPKLSFPGGLIVGDAAGFLNVPRIKGIHTAMKSGMVAAESIFPLLQQSTVPECTQYFANLQKTWVWDELHRARNIRPAMTYGLWPGLAYAALDTYLLRGKAPWTLHHRIPDHESLWKAKRCEKIVYPKHDNEVTFDITQSVYLANINYEENQPYHLKVQNRPATISVNYDEYASPETRYCPAGVYEILHNEKQEPRLQINGGNCIHCKACDIKDPTQNIVWTPSEGGSGPQYHGM